MNKRAAIKPRSVSLFPIDLETRLNHEKGYRDLFLERKSMLSGGHSSMRASHPSLNTSSSLPLTTKSKTRIESTMLNKTYRLPKCDPDLMLLPNIGFLSSAKGYKSFFNKTRRDVRTSLDEHKQKIHHHHPPNAEIFHLNLKEDDDL